jgi:hypothetical protein
MRDVTQSATNVIDVWDYVGSIPGPDLEGHSILVGLVDHVYRNGLATFDHVLVPTETKNVYLTIVVDLTDERVHGHHILDLYAQYGVDQP